MRLPASARRRRRRPVTNATPRDRIELDLREQTLRFTSLSQMDRWLRSNPVRPDEQVTLRRNGKTMYTGLWGGELHDIPTLM